MNNLETVELCNILAQVVPAQKFDEMTPLLWQPLLAGVREVDARNAVKALAKRQPFIGPHDIITEVTAMRSERVKAGPKFDPAAYFGWVPDGASEPIDPDGDGYLIAIRDHTRRLADGEPPLPVPEKPETRRDVAALLAPLLRRSGDV